MPLFHRGISVVVEVQLAGDLGFGISWLVMVLTVSILLATGFFTYVILSTRSRHALLAGLPTIDPFCSLPSSDDD
jgi:hypothetical protein